MARRWFLGLAMSLGVIGTGMTSGVLALANHFVEEFSLPHISPDERLFTFSLPSVVGEPPLALQRPVTFRTSDGKVLRGDFWAQPRPAPTVIISHGYRVTRQVLRPVAALEYAHRYNIFLFDFRGHGESESVATSGGNAEVRDLEAAVAVAVSQAETLPRQIIIHGFSMGAAIALLMQPRPEVAAIIADSSYARLDEVLWRLIQFELLARSRTWRSPFRWVSRIFPMISWIIVMASQWVFLARFHFLLLARPEASLRHWRARRRKSVSLNCPYPPLLLIHSLGDQAIPFEHARQLVERARAQAIPTETYFVEGAGHCDAYSFDPAGYIHVCQSFIGRVLGQS